MKLLVKFSIFIISYILICCSSCKSKSSSDLSEVETTKFSKIYEPPKKFDNPNNINLSPKKLQHYSNENYIYILYSEDSLELARTTINLSFYFDEGKYEIVNVFLNNSISSNHWSLKIEDTRIDSYQCKDITVQRLFLNLKGFQKYTEIERKMKYNKNKNLDKVIETTTKPEISFSHTFQWEFISPAKDVILTEHELSKSNRRDIIKREYKLKKDNLYRISKDISRKLNSGIKGGLYGIGKEEDVFLIRQNDIKIDSLIFDSNRNKQSNETFCIEDIRLDL